MTTEKQAKKIEVRRIREEAIERCMKAWLDRSRAWIGTCGEIQESEVQDIEAYVRSELIPYLYGEEY